MDFYFFENEIFCQIFNMNLDKKNMIFFLLKNVLKIFEKYSKNIFPKV